MLYFGDYIPNSILEHMFNTNDSTGAYAALNSPSTIQVYKGSATTATTAGATVMPNFALSTGMNLLRIDLSSSPTYYANGCNYHAVLSAGWVASIFVTNYSLGDFSIGNRGISSTSVTQIAEAILKLDFSTITGEAARSLLNAARAIRNKVSVAGGTLTVTKENDTDAAWTATVTEDAGALPITSIDPA